MGESSVIEEVCMIENPKHRGAVWFFLSLFAVFSVFAGIHYVFSSQGPEEIIVEISPGLARREVADVLGEALSWSEREEGLFAGTYVEMQWMAFGGEATEFFVGKYGWGEAEREVFLTSSARYFDPELDFLGEVYAPGAYAISEDATHAGIADALITRVYDTAGDDLEGFIEERVSESKVARVLEFVHREMELLPDLVPLPAQDVALENRGGEVFLLFSTTYYNQGKGPLELRADEATAGIRENMERDVFQRIYRINGTHRDKFAGNFLWHQEHLHYHFADFVEYDLTSLDEPSHPDLSGVLTKSTFCIRDVSRVDLPLPHEAAEAEYLICGKERQGISVGWGDTYYYTYPDQGLDLTGLPSGMYRLTFTVNPEERFEEVTRRNNVSSVAMYINMEEGAARVIEESPKEYPAVEHIYPDKKLE